MSRMVRHRVGLRNGTRLMSTMERSDWLGVEMDLSELSQLVMSIETSMESWSRARES